MNATISSLPQPHGFIGNGGASDYIALLRTSGGSVHTFQADVEVEQTVGAGRKRLAQLNREFADWLRKQPNPDEEGMRNVERFAEQYELNLPPLTEFYRYFAMDGRLRIEHYGGPVNGQPPYSHRDAVVQVYTGDRWEVFAPVSLLAKDPLHNTMHVTSSFQNIAPFPLLEVARGQAVYIPPGHLDLLGLANTKASAIDQVNWTELLRVFDLNTAEVIEEPIPSGGQARPVLQIRSPIHPKYIQYGLGPDRVRIWFDSEHAHTPLRLECQRLEPDRRTGKHYYTNIMVADWSEPLALPNGQVISQRCILRHFYVFYAPGEGDQTQWTGQSHELIVRNVKYTNVRINDPLDKTMFKIVPPRGTNVVDEIAGYAYVTGSAGEELQKVALAQQGQCRVS